MQLVGTDSEYVAETAPQGAIAPPPTERPDPSKVYCEMMQLAASKVDASGTEVAYLNLYIKAHKIHDIPLWLQEMTGITPEMRAAGVTFPAALRRFRNFVSDTSHHHVWAFNMDWHVFLANAEAHNVHVPLEEFRRLKPLLPQLGISKRRFARYGYKEVCSGGLADVLGLSVPETPGKQAHDALFDSRSLTAGVHHLREKIYI